ncbi:YrhA family protein [Paenibacillus sp. HW567]|uniref:YrhA family protein n=1 Tax=Paenibacillus sp. HW567 TaxID=1034769 RepID=UPI000375AC4F|nr:YrhA family protein [Paenibacillus sp. HW567]
MLNSLLIEIQKIEERYGGKLNEPATSKDLKKLEEVIKDKFDGLILPSEFIEFLTKVNGLDFNGLVIYGVDNFLLTSQSEDEINGFVETNDLWYENEWQRKFVFFGDSDIAWYCYDLTDKIFLELDKPSGTIMNTFINFNDMLVNALENRLN